MQNHPTSNLRDCQTWVIQVNDQLHYKKHLWMLPGLSWCRVSEKGHKVQNVPTFKYLGYILDSTLTFQVHIKDIIKKVIHKRIMLAELMPFLNVIVAISIYKAMILPYFADCDLVYQGTCSWELDKLQRLQNKCLKTCLGVNRLYDTDQLHCYTKCAKLEDRRKAHVCNFMFTRQNRKDFNNWW